ncbi:MAG: histidine kinase [Chitinophagaceae bacterium]|nr:histidine kinase [Chitinophagaceae bacterium]
MKMGWLNKPWVRVIFHIAAWIIVFSLPFLLRRYPAGDMPKDPDERGFFLVNNLTALLWIGVFYFNAYILTPRFIYTKKYFYYFLIVLGLFAIIMVIHSWLFISLIIHKELLISRSVGFNIPPFMLAIAVSSAYRMIIDKNKTDKLLQQKQEEHFKSELSFLRSQVSPHFMFNVLNNILALARLKSDQLEPTIFKLSTLMRYMLYETDEERVSLQKEIDYLNSYIDLQKQRVGGKVKLEVSIPQAEAHHEIAPMLLIPFIENAFKHGTGHIKNAQIDINMHVGQDTLNFVVRNRYDAAGTNESKDKTSGIGLTNVIRRLKLLYEEKHNLLITKEDGWFVVSLQINLV